MWRKNTKSIPMRHYLLDLLNSKNVSSFHPSFFGRKCFQYMYILVTVFSLFLTKLLSSLMIVSSFCSVTKSRIISNSFSQGGNSLSIAFLDRFDRIFSCLLGSSKTFLCLFCYWMHFCNCYSGWFSLTNWNKNSTGSANANWFFWISSEK